MIIQSDDLTPGMVVTVHSHNKPEYGNYLMGEVLIVQNIDLPYIAVDHVGMFTRLLDLRVTSLCKMDHSFARTLLDGLIQACNVQGNHFGVQRCKLFSAFLTQPNTNTEPPLEGAPSKEEQHVPRDR